jgi:hypothetical protein
LFVVFAAFRTFLLSVVSIDRVLFPSNKIKKNKTKQKKKRSTTQLFTLEWPDSKSHGLFRYEGLRRTYSILDTDYTSYAIVHECRKMFFGLMTHESILLLTRDLTPKKRVLAKLRALANSFDYGGRPFEIELGNEGNICYGIRFFFFLSLIECTIDFCVQFNSLYANATQSPKICAASADRARPAGRTSLKAVTFTSISYCNGMLL